MVDDQINRPLLEDIPRVQRRAQTEDEENRRDLWELPSCRDKTILHPKELGKILMQRRDYRTNGLCSAY